MADLWIIACYFNPNGFTTKRENYNRFIENLRATGAPHIIVECACGSAPFDLPTDDCGLRVRAADALWQKERLLNLALARLPSDCTKVAWVDCDLLFEGRNWIQHASAALETLPVIQPYTSVVRLSKRGQICATSEADESLS